MLSKLIHFSLANRFLVLIAAVLVLAFGIRATTQMPVDVLPELTRPTVTLLTEAPGYDAQLVEKLVTVPIENEVNGTPGTWRLRSSSDVGLSVVWVEFDWGTDILQARQLVSERLAQTQLPEGVRPVMGPIGSLLGEIMIVGLHSTDGKTEPMALRELADWTVARRLQSVKGVSNVLPIGGGIKQYQIAPDPAKVAGFGLTMEQVVEAAKSAVDTSTSNYIVGPQREYVVINDAMSTRLGDIGRTVVGEADGAPVRLEDVAELGFGPQIMRGDGMIGEHPAVLMSVEKSPGTNTLTLTQDIESALEELRVGLPAGVELSVEYQQAHYIDKAVHNLQEALRDGAIFVAIVLILFLLNIRTTVLTLLAIPLSFAVAALVFSWMGLGINSMTLGGLAVAVGMVVDDAIVDVENVFRRLGENRRAAHPRPALEVVADASQEVRGSILYATLLIILVFVPLLFLPDIAGRMFQPIALATIISLTASFVVSLTVVPALASILLPNMKHLREREGWVLKFFKWLSRRFLLPPALNHPWITLGVTVVLLAASIALWPLQGKGFLPPLNEGFATVTLSAAPGTSLENTRTFAATGARLLGQIDGVKSAALRMGRAEEAEHIVGVNTAEWDVEFDTSRRTTEAIMADIRKAMSQIPGTIVAVGAPISHRIDHMVAGVEAQLVVKLFGEDLEQIRVSAEELAAAFRQVPGATDVAVEQQLFVPVVRVRVDRDKAEAQDLAVEEITKQVSLLVGGEVVGEVLDGQRRFDVFLRLPEDLRRSPEEIGAILIEDGHGHVLPLREIADVVYAKAPNVVSREGGQRRIIISANTQGRSVSEVEADFRAAAARADLPEGSFLQYEGQAAQQRATARTIASLSGLVLLAMVALLYSHFRSWSLVIQVLINLPLAFMGGLLANWLMVGELSIASLIGFITLAGIAARNTIMMLSHYLHLVEHEGEGWTRSMVVRGSLERIAPVLMTALTAGLALIPLVLAGDSPGKEILHPLAVVIVGGLISSTLLDMIVTPTVFYHFGMPKAARATAQPRSTPPVSGAIRAE